MDTKSLNQILAGNLRHYRLVKGISQESLSELVNVHRNTIPLLETGKRGVSLDLLYKLARVLDCQAYQLLIPATAAP